MHQYIYIMMMIYISTAEETDSILNGVIEFAISELSFHRPNTTTYVLVATSTHMQLNYMIVYDNPGC